MNDHTPIRRSSLPAYYLGRPNAVYINRYARWVLNSDPVGAVTGTTQTR